MSEALASGLAVAPTLMEMRKNVELAREGGYVCLTPVQRQVAIEFATTGHTAKEIARKMGQPQSLVVGAIADPVVRAFIADLQAEIAQHKIINAAWVEQQILEQWPRLTGEEEVPLVNKAGEQILARKYHAPEVASILKHFSGNADQKKAGAVQVVINFGEMGVAAPVIKDVKVIEGDKE